MFFQVCNNTLNPNFNTFYQSVRSLITKLVNFRCSLSMLYFYDMDGEKAKGRKRYFLFFV